MIKKAFTLLSIAVALTACCNSSKGEFDYLYKNLPFQMEKVAKPTIPNYTVDIKDFGGVGDGVTLNAKAFADAIAHLSSKGGGHLNVPAGIWLTGPIGLESNIDLHVTPDAIVIFDPNPDLYPVVETMYEGTTQIKCESPIHADGAKNISVTGGGVLDGSGEAWRMVKQEKLTPNEWTKLINSGGVTMGTTWYPDESFFAYREFRRNNQNISLDDPAWNAVKRALRPVFVSIRNCENVLLEDCTFQNSPAWNVHPRMCKNLIVNRVTVRNPWYAQNGDGIDIDSCENVLVVNSSFDAGDDGICVKSGKDAEGRKWNRPTKNLIVDNCVVYHGHGGFTVGSEMSGGVHNVKVSNCRFLGTDVGLRFKSTRGRGGVVDNIYIDNVYMKDIVAEAVLFNLYYGGNDPAAMLAAGIQHRTESEVTRVADETTPAFRDIHIKDIVCNGAQRAMLFNGLPEMPVKGIDIENATITSRIGIQLFWSEDVHFKNVNIKPSEGEPVFTENVKNFVFE